MAEDNGNGKKRPLTRSEKFRNYCIGIAALTGLILGVVNIVMGEPRAEKTWITLRDQTNALTETVNRLTKQVIFLQAHESGRTAAELLLKLEAAEKKLARLVAGQAPLVAKKKPTAATTAAETLRGDKPQKKCKEGHVLVEDRCRRVHKAVAKKMKQDETEKVEVYRRLLVEKRKRIEAERRKKQLMQKLAAPHPPAPMKKLPIKLDEAAK